MMIVKNMSIKKYNISSIKQLVDLNGRVVNFHLTFTVKSLTNEPFDALVVTQEMLDSNAPLNYQRAEGEISGQIKNDNNIYNSYFLCLKSDKVQEVEVKTTMEEVPANIVINPVQTNADIVHPRTPRPLRDNYYEDDIVVKSEKVSDYQFYVRLAVVFAVLACIGLGAYYYYQSQKKKGEEETGQAVVGELKNDLSEISDKISKLSDGLSDVTSKVNDSLSDVSHTLSDVTTKVSDSLGDVKLNFNNEFDKLHENIKPVSDLTDIKDSINSLKSLYSSGGGGAVKTPSIVTPPSTPVKDAISNVDDVLSRTMKILNKQA
jgi:hypothetical protein